MRALIIAVAMASVAWSVRGASLSTLLEPSAEGETKVPPLRVCADPDNMPYSRAGAALRSRPTSERAAPSDPTSEERGFEIEIAELLARDLGTRAEYTWWPQRRGFIRNTLAAGKCDVVMGLPAAMDGALMTRPYYRSGYVFVTRSADALDVRDYDDPRLRRLRIGVQLVGDDGANPPPAHALSRRGIVQNIVGFPVYGDHAAGAASKIVAAVGSGHVDVAAVWGPIAGYFVARSSAKLRATLIESHNDRLVPQAFNMAMAVRRGDTARRDRLDRFVDENRGAIHDILDKYAVPRLPGRRSARREVASSSELRRGAE
jgi:mxaJ protein